MIPSYPKYSLSLSPAASDMREETDICSLLPPSQRTKQQSYYPNIADRIIRNSLRNIYIYSFRLSDSASYRFYPSFISRLFSILPLILLLPISLSSATLHLARNLMGTPLFSHTPFSWWPISTSSCCIFLPMIPSRKENRRKRKNRRNCYRRKCYTPCP